MSVSLRANTARKKGRTRRAPAPPLQAELQPTVQTPNAAVIAACAEFMRAEAEWRRACYATEGVVEAGDPLDVAYDAAIEAVTIAAATTLEGLPHLL